MRRSLQLQMLVLIVHEAMSQMYAIKKTITQNATNTVAVMAISEGITTGMNTYFISSDVKNMVYIHQYVNSSGTYSVTPQNSYSPCLSTQSNTIITFSVCILSIPAIKHEHYCFHGTI